MARLYQAEVRYAARNGLARDYQDRHEQLATIRGRIDITAQVRTLQGRRLPLECRYQDYTEDSQLNRVLKAAHRRLLRIPGLGADVLRELRADLRLFGEVAEVDYGPKTVPKLQFNRLNEGWRAPGVLAEMILRQDSLRDVTGSLDALSFTVNMNKVFERFVEAVVRREARRAGLTSEAQARRKLTARVRMKPDLLLREGGRDVAVGDAKYKELALAEWPHADLYQLLAYCDALQLRRGLLIYAGSRRPRTELVKGTNVNLEIIGIDLEGDHREVLARAQAAAARLVEHAVLSRQASRAMAA
jgi:5-methylcytosine-specific restriction enzyme subunit McrC